MAPERISGCLETDTHASMRADIWSVGVLFYILICGNPPFDGKTNEELLEKINKSEFNFHGKEWDNMTDAKNLIYEMLQYEPLERIDAMDAVNHQFFTNILYNEPLQNNTRAKKEPKIIQTLEFFYVNNNYFALFLPYIFIIEVNTIERLILKFHEFSKSSIRHPKDI